MNFQYEILFTVFFQHTYFSSNKLKVLHVYPVEKSGFDILRHGLLFKPFENGFHILYDTNFSGKKRAREEVLQKESFLDFNITNSDVNFFNYTSDFKIDMSQYLFYFKNYPNSHSLHRSSCIEKDDLYNLNTCVKNDCPVSTCRIKNDCAKNVDCPVNKYPEFYFKKPFGYISIKLDNSLEKEYTIQFRSRSTYWRYILVSDYLKELGSPAIIHKNEQFSIIQNDEFPITFVSKKEIELKERPDKGYQLVENYDQGKYKVIISMLPNPMINNISSIKDNSTDNKGKIFSEIFI